jgi:hypothetical protein
MTQTNRVRRTDVENALGRVSRAAIALGLRNRYEIEYQGKGLSIVLWDQRPDFDPKYAKRYEVGKHLRDALLFLEGMAHALERAKAEQDRQEAGLRQRRKEFGADVRRILGVDPGATTGTAFVDPDARSRTRAAEERATDERFCGDDAVHRPHPFTADDEPGSPKRRCPGRKASEVQYGKPRIPARPDPWHPVLPT